MQTHFDSNSCPLWGKRSVELAAGFLLDYLDNLATSRMAELLQAIPYVTAGARTMLCQAWTYAIHFLTLGVVRQIGLLAAFALAVVWLGRRLGRLDTCSAVWPCSAFGDAEGTPARVAPSAYQAMDVRGVTS